MASASINLKSVVNLGIGILGKVQRYILIVVVVATGGAYGFLLWRINTLDSQTPTQDAVNTKLQALTVPKIDQNAISKIQQLQDNSVQVQSLFQQARNNPFQE